MKSQEQIALHGGARARPADQRADDGGAKKPDSAEAAYQAAAPSGAAQEMMQRKPHAIRPLARRLWLGHAVAKRDALARRATAIQPDACHGARVRSLLPCPDAGLDPGATLLTIAVGPWRN